MTGTDLGRLLEFPTVALGRWPTPISTVPRRGGADILVKRDDLSGYGRGGVKTRKIEHVVGYMLAHRYDPFITVVGNVTNLVHDMLPVLRRVGLRWHIFISNDPPLPAAAREESFGDLRAQVHFLGRGYLRAAGRMSAAAVASRARNQRPLIVLPSLMHPAGAAGSARGFIEMVSQARAQGVPLPRTVFITVASGTTLAGFLLAEHALRRDGGAPIRVVGVQVYPGQPRLWTLGLIRWTERFLGLRGQVPADRIEIVSSELHGGFGRYPPQLADLCRTVRETSRLEIDPIFGGKTWSVMESYLFHHPDTGDGPVLYWHCGYTPDWQTLGAIVNRGHTLAE